MESIDTQPQQAQAEPQDEHRWLQRLIGEWTYKGEVQGPDGQSLESRGTERVRGVGGLWVVAEGSGEIPGGETGETMLTLGYDPQKKRFVGTWLGSMMANLWVYEGWLAGDTLTLETEGPSMESPEKLSMYRESIELVGDDHRIFRSQVQGADGNWQEFMKTDYRRRK
jgi:hypothetical protein